jgi:predicted MPP superfamily phosphohydrolase
MKKRFYVLIAFGVLLCYSGLIEPHWIAQTTHDLTIDGLGIKELTIVQIADIHTNKFGRRERETIRRIEEIEPDYILLTGDLFNSGAVLSSGLTFLEKLRAKHGIYFVPGNADGKILSAMRWERIARDTLNCGILMNESVDCGPFVLVGIDDPVSGRENTADAFEGITGTKPVFVMSHFHPDRLLRELEHLGVDIVFSGHTHGGQLGIGVLVGLFPYANRSKYMGGLYKLNHTYLSVTRGIGAGIFPFRFLCRPEIVVFHLRGG